MTMADFDWPEFERLRAGGASILEISRECGVPFETLRRNARARYGAGSLGRPRNGGKTGPTEDDEETFRAKTTRGCDLLLEALHRHHEPLKSLSIPNERPTSFASMRPLVYSPVGSSAAMCADA